MNKQEYLKDILKAISIAKENFTQEEIEACIKAFLDIKYTLVKYPSNINTYRIESIEIAPKILVEFFGNPLEADGYKVSGEYCFKDENNNIFTIYDWKETNLYDEDNPSKECFWSFDGKVEFGIGGNEKSKDTVKEFKEWIIKQTKRG